MPARDHALHVAGAEQLTAVLILLLAVWANVLDHYRLHSRVTRRLCAAGAAVAIGLFAYGLVGANHAEAICACFLR
jgi:hypothetical protein